MSRSPLRRRVESIETELATRIRRDFYGDLDAVLRGEVPPDQAPVILERVRARLDLADRWGWLLLELAEMGDEEQGN
ncbi:MAG: hypothetical protein GX601_18675 [Anaerolineales bacterium]|nr:hypothetical protein [Anaerolineales bacterium]